MRPATLRQLIVLSIAVALSATACYQPLRGPVDVPDVLDPRSPQATLIANFFWFLLAVMTLVSVGVIAALLLFYYRFRARPGREQGQHILGNRRLEIAWTAAPAILLVGVFLYELQAISMLEAPPPTVDDANGEPLRVVAVGQEWWWEFQLPDLGVTTAN
ncbi:MAG TPA: cytochrome c oxidase subunit II transmembrane domain-containing protein, partial [Chloroflexota bacterium]